MLVMIVMFVLGVILQIHLSKKKSKWLGLILPILCFICSLGATVGVVTFTEITTQELTSTSESEEITEEWVMPVSPVAPQKNYSSSLEALMIFTLSNIPTIILYVIYKAYRKKQLHSVELEKMILLDLE